MSRTLSAHALAVLRELTREPLPRLAINPGTCARLLRDGLVQSTRHPSPYKTHNKVLIEFLEITPAGGQVLADIMANTVQIPLAR